MVADDGLVLRTWIRESAMTGTVKLLWTRADFLILAGNYARAGDP
jgi:hypothetical protein